MGSAMAANLVKAGQDVTVFNRSPRSFARSSNWVHTRQAPLPMPVMER